MVRCLMKVYKSDEFCPNLGDKMIRLKPIQNPWPIQYLVPYLSSVSPSNLSPTYTSPPENTKLLLLKESFLIIEAISKK